MRLLRKVGFAFERILEAELPASSSPLFLGLVLLERYCGLGFGKFSMHQRSR